MALQAFMRERNLKAKPWAKAAGVAPALIPNFLAGRSASLNTTSLEKLAAAADSTVADLIGEKIRPARGARDIVAIKSLEVRAAAGGGFEVSDEAEGKPFYFRRDWIETVLHGKPGRLRALEFGGDSMYPTIHDGDSGVINLDAPFESGKVYVMWDGRGVIVKRVEALPGQRMRLRISSDNDAVSKPFVVDSDEVRIIGRVIWIAREI